MVWPVNPTLNTTHQTGHGSIYRFNAKGAWRLQSLGAGYLPLTGVMSISPSFLAAESVGTAVNQTFTASGGTGPYTWAVTSGALPTGLSLNASTGVLSGTPTTLGTYNFALTATDNTSKTVTQAYTVVVNSGIALSPTVLNAMTVGHPFTQTISASGGTAPYTYAVTQGTLPTGLSLNASTGVLNGTPTVAGVYGFVVTATDNVAHTGSAAYSGTVAVQTINIAPTGMPEVAIGTALNVQFTASGGTAPYTWSVAVGSLPTGLSLNATTGVISGTPSAAGTSNFTLQALDNISNWGRQAITEVVDVTPPHVSFYWGGGAPSSTLGKNADFYYDNNYQRLYRKQAGAWQWQIVHFGGDDGSNKTKLVVAGTAQVIQGSGPPSDSVGIYGDYYVDTTSSLNGQTLYGPKQTARWLDGPHRSLRDDTLPPGFSTFLSWGDSATPSVNCQYWIDTRFRMVWQWAYGTTWQVVFNGDAPYTTLIDFIGNGTTGGVSVRTPLNSEIPINHENSNPLYFALDTVLGAGDGPAIFNWNGIADPTNWTEWNTWNGVPA